MYDLLVIVPSRGRPEASRELVAAFRDTCTGNTGLLFSLDDDDPTSGDYQGVTCTGPHKSMVEALNHAAITHSNNTTAIGFMGDDHRPRTRGWDTAYLEALCELGTGIVYGDDLLQGRRLPTQCAMTSDIVRDLGYMSPPELTHMYVDNFWLALGEQSRSIRYLPHVVVEHLHPIAGKARWDDGYKRVNDAAVFDKDARVFADYCRGQLAVDVEKVTALGRQHASR